MFEKIKSLQIKSYIALARLNKPIGILLLLWPTLWALWLAGDGRPDLFIVAVFMVGVVLMRSAGCIINDIADRHIDGHVERTRTRPLITKELTVKQALIFFSILLTMAFCLVCLLNWLTILLAFVGALFAVSYPFMKRVTHLPQVGLGMAFSWGVPMAFAAQMNTVPAKAWVLFLAAALWPMIYDTLYAMTDREDDLKAGVKSTAILFAKWDKFIIGLLQLIFLGLMIWVGYLFKLDEMYYLSLLIASLFFIYQQFLIKNRLRENCFKAFLNNHWVGFFVFFGILI